MLLLGHLAKVQGLKGEVLLHCLMDEPERLPDIKGLLLAPPEASLEGGAVPEARPVTLKGFRWHQERACVSFVELPDRTAVEALKGWALWMPEEEAVLPEGDSFRHDWFGCEVYVDGALLGEVVRLDPTPMGYDMVIIRDRRPGRRGNREVPYIKAWFTLDLEARRIALAPPPGLLDLDRLD